MYKLQKTKDKEEILKKARVGKKQLTHSGTRIKMTSEFASATMHTGEEQSEIFSV